MRNWSMDGWTSEDYDEMTRQAEALRVFIQEQQDLMSCGGAFTPKMLAATAEYITSKALRLALVADKYHG